MRISKSLLKISLCIIFVIVFSPGCNYPGFEMLFGDEAETASDDDTLIGDETTPVCGDGNVRIIQESLGCEVTGLGFADVDYQIVVKNSGSGYAHDVKVDVETFTLIQPDGTKEDLNIFEETICELRADVIEPGEAKGLNCELLLEKCPSTAVTTQTCRYLSTEEHNKADEETFDPGMVEAYKDLLDEAQAQFSTGIMTYDCSVDNPGGWEESECPNGYEINSIVMIGVEDMIFSYDYFSTCSVPSKSNFQMCNINRTHVTIEEGGGLVYKDGWLLGLHNNFHSTSWDFLDCDDETTIEKGSYPDEGLVGRLSDDLIILQLGYHYIDWKLPIENIRDNNIQSVEGINKKWPGFLHRIIDCTLTNTPSELLFPFP